jgi:hypothetical protein
MIGYNKTQLLLLHKSCVMFKIKICFFKKVDKNQNICLQKLVLGHLWDCKIEFLS